MDKLLSEIDDALTKVPMDFGGGCSVRKAYVMGWLIRAFRLTRTLDVGVYRGRSLFPQAIAHRTATGGIVHGVDPWLAIEASEDDNPVLRDEIKVFVETTDFEEIFQNVTRLSRELELSNHIQILRTTSAQAANQFALDGISFGLIHIDGNHDEASVMADVELYLPLLEQGGFLVMDDVSWGSVQPAERKVASCTRLLIRCITPDKMNDYAIYWKGGSWPTAPILSLRLQLLARA